MCSPSWPTEMPRERPDLAEDGDSEGFRYHPSHHLRIAVYGLARPLYVDVNNGLSK